MGVNFHEELEIELKQTRLGSSSELGSNEERRFIILGGMLNMPISNNLPSSHRGSNTRL